LLTSEHPEPHRVLQPSSTTPQPSVLSQETSEIERQVLRKLLIDLFYASPRRTSEVAMQEGRQKKNVHSPQEMGQQSEGVSNE